MKAPLAAFAVIFALVSSAPLWAAPGDLDPSFDGDGKLTTVFPGGSWRANAVVVQGDGQIVGAGGDLGNLALARYNTNGSLDTAYDTDGKVTTNFGGGPSDSAFGHGAMLQADGRIVVVGVYAHSGDQDFATARYNTNGSLDTSFDGDGKVVTPFGTGTDRAYDGAVQTTDQHLVVAGSATIGGSVDFAVLRYNTNGSLDTSFDGDGKVTTAIGSGDDVARGVAIQPSDGKIVVAGYSSNGSNDDFAVVRYNTNGSLDTSFDGDGKVTTAIGSAGDTGYDVAIQNDGKIVVAGYSFNGSDNDFAVVRYNTNGSLDTGFGTGGKVTTDFGGSYEFATQVVIQPDGKILLAGTSFASFALARYNTNGTLDTSFGSGGKVTTSFGVTVDASGLAMQSDGYIVVVGGTQTLGGSDFAVARYVGDSPLPTATPVPTVTPTPVLCGNGSLDPGEQCDDGNTVGGDCCSVVCQYEELATPCNDGNACTQTDTCNATGTCIGGNPVICPASDGCHDPGTCTAGVCSNPAKANGTPCSDGDTCATGDTCQSGACTAGSPLPDGTSCSDHNPCTATDACMSGACVGNDPLGDGTSCDDGNPCTGSETCQSGVCTGSAFPADTVCDDGNDCTGVSTCQSGSCVGSKPVIDGTLCDDGYSCTASATCQAGMCVTDISLSDGTLCGTDDECLTAGTCQQGVCAGIVPVPDGSACDDGEVCSLDDLCRGGECRSKKPAADGIACDDGEACTSGDQCMGGHCVGSASLDGTACDDGDDCTLSDTCQQGVCTGSNPLADGTACDDGTLCTDADACRGGRCVGSTAPRSCRTPAQADKASFQLKDKAGTKSDKVQWKWNKGAATSVADFGDPTDGGVGGTDYALCIYRSGSPRPLMALRAPRGGTCPNGVACWKLKNGQFKYKDKGYDPDGLSAAQLKSSATAGKASASVQGKGALLHVPHPPFASAIRVELRRSGSSLCWGADHTTVQKNDRSTFKAKGD